MIEIGGQSYALDDPAVMLAIGGALVAGVIVVLLIMAVRAAGRSARMAEPVSQQLAHLGHRVQHLSDGQQQLAGGLTHVA